MNSRSRRVRLALFVAFALVILPASAFAQTPSALPTVTPLIAIVTIFSLLVGIGTQVKQTGTILGKPLTPTTMTVLTMALPALGGILSVLQGASAITPSLIFWAVIAGVGQMFTASVPGMAVHAHIIGPEHSRALVMLQKFLSTSVAPSPGAQTPAKDQKVSS